MVLPVMHRSQGPAIGAMNALQSHSSTMRPSNLQTLGRMSLRALKRVPAATAATVQPAAPHAAIRSSQPCSSINSFTCYNSSRLPAAVRRALICSSSRAVAAAAAASPVLEAAAPQQQAASSSSNGNGSISTAPSFQEAIKRLQDYWASVGCIVWLPHNTEVGAGTMNPATFLR